MESAAHQRSGETIAADVQIRVNADWGNTMHEKIVLIGAGSAMFTRGVVGDVVERGWKGELALVDIDPAALKVAEGLACKIVAARPSSLRITAATERRRALRGATAVITTIGVGGRRAWEQDVYVPRRHGIYQPVGDSVMPGGTSRALRMIPPMVDIARDVLDLAPKALFFNYSNPMGAVCRGVCKATGAPMVGLCHGVESAAYYVAEALGVTLPRLTYNAVGMNHLTWLMDVRVDGRNAMPRLIALANERAQRLDDSPFSWQLLRHFGAFPAVMDRHVTEFFPWFFRGKRSYFGKTLGVDVFSFEQTIAHGDRIFDEMRTLARSRKPLIADFFKTIAGEHQQVLGIIDSIRRGQTQMCSANLPNTGQVPNLPVETVVESPAVVDGYGVHAIAQPPLPAGLAGTLATRFQWVETVVEAALEGSRDKFIQALILDGAVESLDAAARLADDLLAVQARYLPNFSARRRRKRV
jgi:alpha-galactosidase